MSAEQDNKTLKEFWNKALALSEDDKKEVRKNGPEGWKEQAPSQKLFEAARFLGQKKKVLDYGCGSAWAGIIAAKSGCADVTAVDVVPGAVNAAEFYASLYDVKESMSIACVGPDWLSGVPSGTYDGLFCSNVLDVVPPETAEVIIREISRIAAPDASVIIGLNFWLSPEAAAKRGLQLEDGRSMYVDGVLRLVSRSDAEWESMFSPWYTVEKLEHFAWPGEAKETRRLFYLKKK